MADNKTKAAVVREIEIIGEAARQIAQPFRGQHENIDWAALTRLRNLYIHVYHRIDYRNVWHTATKTVPVIAVAVRAMIPPKTDDPA